MKTRIAKITEDATVSERASEGRWVQLHYVKYGKMRLSSLGSALPEEKVPFWKELKKGTKIKITYRDNIGSVGSALEKIEVIK